MKTSHPGSTRVPLGFHQGSTRVPSSTRVFGRWIGLCRGGFGRYLVEVRYPWDGNFAVNDMKIGIKTFLEGLPHARPLGEGRRVVWRFIVCWHLPISVVSIARAKVRLKIIPPWVSAQMSCEFCLALTLAGLVWCTYTLVEPLGAVARYFCLTIVSKTLKAMFDLARFKIHKFSAICIYFCLVYEGILY